MQDSWAYPAIQWLLTPALVTGVLIALAQYYDPPTRWGRRLKSDIAVAGGLPSGPERSVWDASIAYQAARLREYRRAFVGRTLFWKWVGVIFIGVTLTGLILYPPINKPGDAIPYAPADYMMMAMGGILMIVSAVAISSGRDYWGRTPREIVLRRRVRQFDQRLRKLRRIEKERARRAEADPAIRARGSRLGFSTQVDEFGPWVRDAELRLLVKSAGWVGADLADRSYQDLRRRGLDIPPWPEPRANV